MRTFLFTLAIALTLYVTGELLQHWASVSLFSAYLGAVCALAALYIYDRFIKKPKDNGDVK